MRRLFSLGLIVVLVFCVSSAWAQKSVRLSIATGGTGGVYYPLGGGMANIISKYIAYTEATAEVTTASVDNCRLVGAGKAELALIMADTGWDAYQGRAQFKEKVPLRTVAVLYPNNMHVVTLEGKGIEKMTDLKGKRVSTGAPGSGTEVMALRVIEAFGLDPTKDMTRDKLGVSESAGALKDRKIDAFFWVGGLPTAAITDLGATPGIKMKLIGHGDALTKMRETYGPIYVKGVIPAKTYPGQEGDVPITIVWNLLVCHDNMKGDIVYDIVKTFFDHKQELITVHREARWLSLEPQATGGSPIPFHPGAIRYFTEKGLKIK
ncbi:MAG TPA: TAXI family TRAP transporter solute-binding subunit [Thermodesulfobacteriota bacterium]|nr:TAXI family TRAP transporter solute-binding subunit [Thermodesulfobacteriota bacterium]